MKNVAVNQEQEKLQVVQRFENYGQGWLRSASEGYCPPLNIKAGGTVSLLPEGHSAWTDTIASSKQGEVVGSSRH